MNRPATKKQLWTLYCLSKKDYRNENLSVEEASDLIKTIIDKLPMTKKVVKESMENRLYKYLIDDKNLFDRCCGSLKLHSVVEDDPMFNKETKKYHFIGCGCGITYLKYDKRSPKAKELDNCHNRVIQRLIDTYINKFSKREQKYYESIGCPLSAIFHQDYEIQRKIYSKIVEFANNELGINNITYESYYD